MWPTTFLEMQANAAYRRELVRHSRQARDHADYLLDYLYVFRTRLESMEAKAVALAVYLSTHTVAENDPLLQVVSPSTRVTPTLAVAASSNCNSGELLSLT
jgi:hypothetical protein